MTMLLNAYQAQKNGPFRKIECGDLLFVEYVCSPENPFEIRVLMEYDCLIFVTSGRKDYCDINQHFILRKDQALFCKKGGAIINNYYEEDFCGLFCFFDEKIIREVIESITFSDILRRNEPHSNSNLITIDVDLYLKESFNSLTNLLSSSHSGKKDLLKHKFKEILMHFLIGDKPNQGLLNYFYSKLDDDKVLMERVMNSNFTSPLSIMDFSKLCNKSESTFKREFKKLFGTSPGKWLSEKRLIYAENLLSTTSLTVNQVSYNVGFESVSHFIRIFKSRFGMTPEKYRNSLVRS